MKKYKEEYLQCCACGHIHKERFQYKDDDNPYVGFKCNKCKQYVRHLRCGENQDDIMIYYNPVYDDRFFQYSNTQQND